MTSTAYKKIMSSMLVVFIVLSVFVLSFAYNPKTAHAVPGVFVPTNDVLNNLKESSLDAIGWTIANLVLSQISASIVNWINTGFEGSPAFVTDFKGFLTDIADEELGRFIEGSELDFLCSPFAFDIKFSLALQAPFDKRISCTLTDVVGNIDSFISGNFSEGGWQGWFELTTKSQNNPYGAFLLTSAELNSRIAGKQEIELFKVDLGDGFLSLKTCLVKNSDGKCLQSQITLPGKVIESQLNNTLAGGQQRLNVADEFDEIVVALFSQLIQQVLFDGLLSGGTSDYTNDLGGENAQATLERIRDDILDEADRIITSEEIYKITKEGALNLVIQEDQQLLQLRSCYESRGGGSPASVDTTIENIIDPLKESLNIDIANAQTVIDKLNLIKIEILTASTLNELTDFVFKLRDVDIHNLGDAQNEHFQVSTQLNSLNTQQKLQACLRDN
ncbi:hypothetical protein IIB50_01905 [Patescibacteria group bacterium]|nr:hypothetical protein [Patescibacteria group bacterium]